MSLKIGDIRKRKGRDRVYKGKLKNFKDLPFCIQAKFKLMAYEINNILGRKIESYVYGSYYWGWWDNESDLDIRLHTVDFPITSIEFKNRMIDKYNYKVDLMIMKEPLEEMNLITIPL